MMGTYQAKQDFPFTAGRHDKNRDKLCQDGHVVCVDRERKTRGKKLKLIIVWSEGIICDSQVLLSLIMLINPGQARPG